MFTQIISSTVAVIIGALLILLYSSNTRVDNLTRDINMCNQLIKDCNITTFVEVQKCKEVSVKKEILDVVDLEEEWL